METFGVTGFCKQYENFQADNNEYRGQIQQMFQTALRDGMQMIFELIPGSLQRVMTARDVCRSRTEFSEIFRISCIGTDICCQEVRIMREVQAIDDIGSEAR